MEYKLNKIDTELITRVNNTTKPGKIHKENTVKFNLEKNDEKNKQNENNKNTANKENTNKEERKDDGTGKYLYVRK